MVDRNIICIYVKSPKTKNLKVLQKMFRPEQDFTDHEFSTSCRCHHVKWELNGSFNDLFRLTTSTSLQSEPKLMNKYGISVPFKAWFVLAFMPNSHCPLALSRGLTECQPPRSDALLSVVVIGSPVSYRTFVIYFFGGLPLGLGFVKSSR